MGMSASLDAAIKAANLPYKLAPLQIEDIEAASMSDRFAWFLEVGLGKTVCSTMVALVWDEDHTIIIVPPIISDQWETWLHSIGQKDTSIFRGARRTIDMLDHKWVIMSHSIFRDSAEAILDFYTDKGATLIVDEAQAIKNPASKLFKTTNRFIQPDRRIQMLTATPTSKPEDTYSYMRIKTPKVYRSFGHWENVHVEDRDIFGTITKYNNLDLLAGNFAMKSIKRTKKEVFGYDLDPIYDPIIYKLAPAHLKLYNQLAEEQLLLLDNGEKIDATSAQRLRHALQQIVVNWGKFSGKEADRSTAYDLLDTVISQVDPMDKLKSKLVVWTYYQSTSGSVTAYLKGKFGDRAVVAAYGAVDSKKSIKAIMEDDECRILVAQPSSCGVGLNMQHVCSEMLFIEMATTPMQIKQAIGRIDRVGQLVKPTIRFGQASHTIQIKLFNDLLRNDDLVTKVERSLTSLRDEIFGKN